MLKKNSAIFIFVFIFCFSKFSAAQIVAGNIDWTIKKINERISENDNPNRIKLRLNSDNRNQYSSSLPVQYNNLFTKTHNNLFTKASGKSILLQGRFDSLKLSLEPYSNKYKEDTLNRYKPWIESKHFGLAAGEWALFNLFIPWAMARYGREWAPGEVKWPYIGWQSIWSNLENGWKYDGDNFETNFFAHPYGGNLFYNSGRTNGYNFWESFGFAMAGSFVWETIMETHPPAINDWVTTSMNGTAFGAALYRISTFITDNEARGLYRVETEFANAILNPVRFFTRLVNGELSRVYKNQSWRRPDLIKLYLWGGTRTLYKDAERSKQIDGIFTLRLFYGDRYVMKNRPPFSYFFYELAIASTAPNLTSMTIEGNMLAWGISNKKFKESLQLTLNYDYYNNVAFIYGSASVVAQVKTSYAFGKKSHLGGVAGIRIIPMGGTSNDYYQDETDGRNYDFGPGLGIVARVQIRGNRDFEILGIGYQMNTIWTESYPTGSTHIIQYADIKLQLPLRDYFALGVDFGFYKRDSHYYNGLGPDVSFYSPDFKVFFNTRIL